MTIYRPTYVRVHLDRLMSNFLYLRSQQASQPFICPMIKANAYGHGDIGVAKSLEKHKCQHLGVASVEEGLHLRKHNISTDVLVFGFYGLEAVGEILNSNLTPVVSDFEQLENIAKLSQGPTKIHLKVNTGMNRLGFVQGDEDKITEWLKNNRHISVEGIGTHFFSGENLSLDGESSQQQLKVFTNFVRRLSIDDAYLHVYNSAAVASLKKAGHQFHFGSRPGLLVYGIDPADKLSLKPLVSPVMEFNSKIVAQQEVKSGGVVSYGGTWRADRDSRIGIVPAGYADGVDRGLSNKGEVLIRGQRCPIRGRVCMDYIMVDLSDMKDTATLIGEEVVLIGQQGGEQITVEEVAAKAGRISYTIMTGIGERVPRVYGDVR